MSDINKELSDYLKTKKGLHRLMNKLKEKYIKLSKPTGTIILKNITKEESIDISNLLGKKIYEEETLKTSYKEITKKINEGKYSNFDWINLFKFYFNENITTKKEEKNTKESDEYIFFKTFYDENKDKKYIKELKEILNEKSINKIIKQKYHKDKNSLKKELNNILLLLDNIKEKPTPLAVYSSLTGNPHYLDLNKPSSNLFLKILSIIKNVPYQNTITDKVNLLSEINVYIDPISNYVITYKLIGNNILNELSDNNEVINLNLLNINNIENITTKNKKVFIFENPSILNSLKYLNTPIIITSGIPNISVYEVITKLINTGNKIYYNGDFDPEGLLIAQKLKDKYKDLELFCYEQIDYNISKSDNEISISRLKKLDSIKDKDLQTIKNLLLKNKISAYQEQNIDRIKEFILKNK